ncbi:MAG TPA: class I SAM-dependent methyltransferase [Micromonosporaceae bacterium]|nr:class I SAM-dependent methyltransferase [Micromonosporaceae bacterium]
MDPARSFGSAARCYDRIRPGYPPEALRWAIGDAPRRVVDLGAGTGILTRALMAFGHEVLAVEPDARMRTRLEQASGVAAMDGSAEAIPLPDGSVDAVLAGQAYHWFDPVRAHPEVARVLRPGGVFAPIWNFRDEDVPWLRELSRIVDGARATDGTREDEPEEFGEWFAPIERAEFRHATTHNVESLLELVRSRSYYLTAPPEQRAVTEAAVRQLVDTHPDLADAAEFALPYVTRVYRAARR